MDAITSAGTFEPIADVPISFNVEFVQDLPYSKGILSSKASGEPPLVLATSVFAALKHAILAAREDRGLFGAFQLDAPATVDQIALACGFVPERDFRLDA